MSKHLTLVLASLMTIGSQVSAADTYQCSGTVGNAYDPWKPEYEVYANRTVTFARRLVAGRDLPDPIAHNWFSIRTVIIAKNPSHFISCSLA